ncbi:AMP-binding protein [Phycicoccus sp. CSK15P-2]|uniref:AMP-binding protein n=1 Tax=Phycicoccus sp. CSK15P-2 TaxID=2807627 RepID=UPI00195286DF|nr:AMP-binding protein [Phycicoccus sp. CSK15P-2]MBM6404808.1 AMP-binding protein [Phycicoccus sp. CSK15P-2]
MTLRSDLPDLDLPPTPLHRLALDAGEAGRVAVTADADGSTYTYEELRHRVGRVVAGLEQTGFGPGDVLALSAANSPDHVVAYLAALAAGGAVLHLNPLDLPDDHVRQVRAVGVRALVTDSDETALYCASDAQAGDVFTTGRPAGPWATLDELAERGGDPSPGVPADPGALASIMFSSGTSGHPKAVALTHGNLVAATLQTVHGIPLDPDESTLAVAPFHHAFGLVMVLCATLAQGATVVTMPRFDPARYLSAVQEHGVTRLYVVPTIVSLLARSPLVDEYDMSSVRRIVCGGAALEPGLARRCRERLGCGLAQGYGMTEAMMSVMQRDFGSATASVGLPSAGVSVRVVDPTTERELPDGAVGEVRILGPHVTAGYLGDPDATAAAFDADGYLRTGDLGRVDEHGTLTIGDRLKEVIKYKGQQVSPTELEQILLTHPQVLDAAVVGVPDEEASEVPKAYVVSADPLDAAEVLEFVNTRVAPYKKVRRFEQIDEIPKTPVGKIARQRLRAAG